MSWPGAELFERRILAFARRLLHSVPGAHHFLAGLPRIQGAQVRRKLIDSNRIAS